MSKGNIWIYPDNRIKKEIIKGGTWGSKPTEACECSIKIEDCTLLDENIDLLNNKQVVIGENDSNFGRYLDIVLQTMHIGEIAKVSFAFEVEVTCTLHLISFIPNGLIYEWNAKEKYDRAVKHKEVGNDLYKKNRYVDASYRFGKALKILCSIPIEVDEPPEEKDGIKITEVDLLKVVLYNNLASCYMKHKDYETVINLCQKIFKIDPDNIKALYKNGSAWYETHDYEKAQDNFARLLKIQPDNKAALEKMKANSIKLAEVNTKLNAMVKRMFQH